MWLRPVWLAHLWSCFASQRWQFMPSASASPSRRLSAFMSDGLVEHFMLNSVMSCQAYLTVLCFKMWKSECVCVFLCRVRPMSSSLAWSTPGPCVSLQSVWPTASHVPSLHPLVSNTVTLVYPHLPLPSLHLLSLSSIPSPSLVAISVYVSPLLILWTHYPLLPASLMQNVWICCCSPRHPDTESCEPDAHSAPVSAQSSPSFCLLQSNPQSERALSCIISAVVCILPSSREIFNGK